MSEIENNLIARVRKAEAGCAILLEALESAKNQLIQEAMCCETTKEEKEYTVVYIDPINSAIAKAKGEH